MAQSDLGNITVKEVLEKKMGAEAAGRVMKEVNDAQQQGKQGEELYDHFKDAMKQEGYDVTSDKSDILYGFIVPIPA